MIVNKEVITEYHSRGHAQGKKESLTVCNGLSAMEYQFLYSVEGLCPKLADSGAKFEVEKGDFHLHLSRSPEGEEGEVYRILSRVLMIGVMMLKKHHPGEIDVEILR